MIDETQLLELLQSTESFRLEKTAATNDSEKFREAICAFANDLPGSGKPGFLLIGYDDKKKCPTGLQVTDELLQKLSSYARDGTILPAPALAVYKLTLSSGEGEIAVVEVQPSELPPVRYRQRICVRTGPRRSYANQAEECLLNERRRAAVKPFDNQPCLGSSLADLATDLFISTYLPQAVAPEIVVENNRSLEHQMASLRLFDLNRNCPTHAGILLFAKDPWQWLSSAYVQFVQFKGPDLADEVLKDKRYSGDLLSLLRGLDSLAADLPSAHPVNTSALRETTVFDYPPVAIRELLMNAVMHRSYEAASPIRFYQFSDRLEIISPGALYGEATPENFPRQTSYRNPVVAEAMKVLGYVNQFGRGVARAQTALGKNGSPAAKFEFGDTFFGVTIPKRHDDHRVLQP